MHLFSYARLKSCRRVRYLGHGPLHPFPIRPAELPFELPLRALPMRLPGRDLLPAGRCKPEQSLAPVRSSPHRNPAALFKECQGPRQRGAVELKPQTQTFLIGFADHAERREQAELRNFKPGFSQLSVVKSRHHTRHAPQVLASARQCKQVVGRLFYSSRHSRCIYIYVRLFVKWKMETCQNGRLWQRPLHLDLR